MSYKEGIIKAIKELNAGDGSTVARIKKFMKENDLPSEQTTWNDRVFHLSLATLVLVGDLDEAKTANYKLSSKYILKWQAKSMFSIDLTNRGEMLFRDGCMRGAMFDRLKGDLDNADRFTAEYLKEKGLTPDVVMKLREVQGRSKEEKDLEIAAFELGLKALGKRIISVQALGDVPYSAWWDPENQDFTPIHMDDATYEALIEHSDYAAEHPKELMLPLGDFLFKEYSAEHLRQYLCFYDESKMDISLANTIAKLAHHLIFDLHDDRWHSIKHWANLLLPLTTDELKESANAEGLSEDGSKVDIAIRLTGHFHKYKFMPIPEE